MRRIAIVMAGGSGERFWPLSTPQRPKQLLDLTGDGKPLLQLAIERADALADPGQVYLATLPRLKEASQEAIPALADENILTEPYKKNTAGALIWAMAKIAATLDDCDDAVFAILTADQRISPMDQFLATAERAIKLAVETEGLVTIGIRPTRPETGFGYLEMGDEAGPGFIVERFREKPNQETAEEFVDSGRFLWNAGMFFWTAKGFNQELEEARPRMKQILDEVIAHLRAGQQEEAELVFSLLPGLSIDYALMERSDKVFGVEATFEWDDLGSWDALPRSIGVDSSGSTIQGRARLIESNGCIVSTQGQRVNLLGVDDLVVVVTPDEVMVLPKERSQEVKRFSSMKD